MPATACLAPNNMISQGDISQCAAEYDFSAAYCFAPIAADGAPQEVRTLVLLAKAYTPGGVLVDAFYPCSNAAYHAAKRMAEALHARYGTEVWHLSNLRLKPMCNRLAAFGRGINTLNYLPQFGSRFCLELLGLSEQIDESPAAPYPSCELPCDACKRCMRSCPTGAITADGFVRERCIRNHMLSGKPMPEEARLFIGTQEGARGIVGCDICQRVCPANCQMEKKRTPEERFALDDLLLCAPDTLREFGDLYGKNYAIRNRILAQAVLAAANTGDSSYLPAVEALMEHPSSVVREHAGWSAKKLKKDQNIY